MKYVICYMLYVICYNVICSILAYFCLNLVVTATPFVPLKILIAYFNSRTLKVKTLLFTWQISRFLAHNWNKCNFGWFLPKFCFHGNSLCSLENLPKFGCHGKCLGSLKISHSILEFADPKNPTIYAIIVTISCTKLKSVQFWLIFVYIWLPWQLPWFP